MKQKQLRKLQKMYLDNIVREIYTKSSMIAMAQVEAHNRPDYKTRPKTTIHDLMNNMGRITRG